jgi:hypothetical protein
VRLTFAVSLRWSFLLARDGLHRLWYWRLSVAGVAGFALDSSGQDWNMKDNELMQVHAKFQ